MFIRLNTPIWFVMILCLSATPLYATTKKKMRSALEANFEITKRTMTGKVKKPGTVLYIRTAGMFAEPPGFSVPTTIIKNGSVDNLSKSTKPSDGIPLRVGEPMHIYSIATRSNRVTLQLATESTYDDVKWGKKVPTHFQMAFVFKYDSGLKSVSIDRVLSDIAQIAITSEAAEELPEMLAVIEALKTQKEEPARQQLTAEAKRQSEIVAPKKTVASEPVGKSSKRNTKRPAKNASIADREAAKRKELSRNHDSVNFQVSCSDMYIPEIYEKKHRKIVPVYAMVVLNNSNKRYTVHYDLVYKVKKDAVSARKLFGTKISGIEGYSETLSTTKKFSIRPGAFAEFLLIEKSQQSGAKVVGIEAVDIFKCTSP